MQQKLLNHGFGGRSMKEAHKEQNLTDVHLDRDVFHLEKAMTSLGVDKWLIK